MAPFCKLKMYAITENICLNISILKSDEINPSNVVISVLKMKSEILSLWA